LSPNGLTAQNVLGEIGAARVLARMKGMLLLPVLVESMPVPDFISDFYCFRLYGQDCERLAEELDGAIVENVNLSPRIFISHKHKDEPIAAALVELLEHAFDVKNTDIRCTSVLRYGLRPGERASDRLRSDIAGAEVVIGILTPGAIESDYVLCELGASWGRDIPTFPVLARGATVAHIPPPLNERHSLSLENEDRCQQLVEYVANKTSIRPREGQRDEIARSAGNLATAAASPGTQASSS
jgi:TIR domain-containing protein